MTKIYRDQLLEEMNGKFDLLLEIIIPMKEKVDRIPLIEERLERLEIEMHTLNTALKATNMQVTDHEHRITRLETKPA